MGEKNDLGDTQKVEAIASFLLRPFRLVRDPVHEDIWLTRLESTIVDQPLFQRLRGIRQLAVSHFVYPGAVHTRFEHSLGTLYVADKIAREAKKNCGSRGYLSDVNGFYLMRERDRLLIRLLALLHDAAHVPFGHLIEDEAGFTQKKQWADKGRREFLSKNLIDKSISIFINTLHDSLNKQFEFEQPNNGTKPARNAGECDSSCRNDFHRLVKQLFSDNIPDAPTHTITSIATFLTDQVKPELISALTAEEEGNNRIQELSRPFIAEAVGDTVCADLLDYLARDSYFTGIGERYDRRIFTYFVTFNQGNKPHIGLLIKKRSKGVRIDAARYIAKLLDMRYALAQMVYTHPAKRMFSALTASMFGSWAMYELYREHENGIVPRGITEFGGQLQRKVNELILRMTMENGVDTDDALLANLMMLGSSMDKSEAERIALPFFDGNSQDLHLSGRSWMERTAALARAIKYREKWRRKQFENFSIDPAGEIKYKNPNVRESTLAKLGNMTGAGRMRIEEELERLLRELFIKRKKSLPNAALVALHVPKVFKPKEADVNVVLVHDRGNEREAYAGHFKHLETGHWGRIKKINGRGSLNESDHLMKQAEMLQPMLGVLKSTADATVKLTVAEYYLHPKADEFLKETEAESEFTEIAELMVALRRNLASEDRGGKKIGYQSGSAAAEDYYKRFEVALRELAGKVGAKYEPKPELAAAHTGESQIPTDLRPADFIEF